MYWHNRVYLACVLWNTTTIFDAVLAIIIYPSWTFFLGSGNYLWTYRTIWSYFSISMTNFYYGLLRVERSIQCCPTPYLTYTQAILFFLKKQPNSHIKLHSRYNQFLLNKQIKCSRVISQSYSYWPIFTTYHFGGLLVDFSSILFWKQMQNSHIGHRFFRGSRLAGDECDCLKLEDHAVRTDDEIQLSKVTWSKWLSSKIRCMSWYTQHIKVCREAY
jgi:hypothetical protein